MISLSSRNTFDEEVAVTKDGWQGKFFEVPFMHAVLISLLCWYSGDC